MASLRASQSDSVASRVIAEAIGRGLRSTPMGARIGALVYVDDEGRRWRRTWDADGVETDEPMD